MVQWEYREDDVEIDIIAYDNCFEGVDDQIHIHRVLKDSEHWRSEYAELKRAHDGAPINEYQEAKKRFFNKLLEQQK
jgi:GrpB-like predicted nucleotidyltransferase (UPF0157 family)